MTHSHKTPADAKLVLIRHEHTNMAGTFSPAGVSIRR